MYASILNTNMKKDLVHVLNSTGVGLDYKAKNNIFILVTDFNVNCYTKVFYFASGVKLE